MLKKSLMLAVPGFLLVLLSVFFLWRAQSDVRIVPLQSDSTPVTLVLPEGDEAGARPLVLVGHGFAGSGVLMRGYALTLAKAGYPVALWDFAGHGANPKSLGMGDRAGSLQADAEQALALAQAYLPGGVEDYAILGHSMGSGVALRFGTEHPATLATIAISPVSQGVTPELPRNLLLQAGQLEAPFVQNARRLLAQAGGEGGDPALGTARALLVVPYVEHISILFNPVSHQAALEWINAAAEVQSEGEPYSDRRIAWYGVGILGALLLSGAAGTWMRSTALEAEREDPPQPFWRRAGALLAGGLAAVLILWLVERLGFSLFDFLGLYVGGYLLLWMGMAGLLSLLLQGWHLPRPSGRAVLAGLLAFAALWLGVGLLGHFTWLHWLLIPKRLVLWPLAASLALLWLLAASQAFPARTWRGWLGAWLAHSLLFIALMLLALTISPNLGFLTIILPLFPLMLGLHLLAAAPSGSRWAYALSGALFLGWTLVAVFPLA